MIPKLIAIAGGSGSGKSSLAMVLQDRHPETIGLIQLDDYFRE